VRWCVCEVVATVVFRLFIAPNKNFLNFTQLCPALCYVVCAI
jgi:hypothetical protein